ncbi:hypothetical protein Ddc_19093 [Ditylenchus destructor]|nr:hypothetical protein Ddc_19093 [Ditylenchus destructor]
MKTSAEMYINKQCKDEPLASDSAKAGWSSFGPKGREHRSSISRRLGSYSEDGSFKSAFKSMFAAVSFFLFAYKYIHPKYDVTFNDYMTDSKHAVSSFVSQHQPPMASNGNQPSHANSADASYQLAQQTPFTSQPFLPQLMHNLTVPASEFHQNRSNDRVLSSQHSTPRTFFTPPTTQLLQSTTGPAQDYQNHSDYRQQSSQVAALVDDYESRIRALNQDISHLKSSEEQKLFYLGANCAKLNDELLKKDSELEAFKALNGLLESQSLALAQEKRDFEAQCAKLKDELNEKDSELKVSHDLLESQIYAVFFRSLVLPRFIDSRYLEVLDGTY